MTQGLAGAWFFGLSLVLVACGSDSSSSSSTKPPTIAISSMTLSEGQVWDAENNGPDATLMLPCDGSIAVGVTTTNWSARAPGGCGQTQSCGHTEAIATAENGAKSRALAVSNPFLRLPTDALAEWVGSGSVLARLVHDDNSPYLDKAGEEIATTVNVTFSAAVDCTASGGSGTGGTTSTGGASGAPSAEGGAPFAEGGAPSAEGGAGSSAEGGAGSSAEGGAPPSGEGGAGAGTGGASN